MGVDSTEDSSRHHERIRRRMEGRQTPLLDLMLLTIKDLSTRLNIKPSTLYLWTAQGKIPSRKIHGLIRFDPEAITAWLHSFEPRQTIATPRVFRKSHLDLDRLIEAAKREVYTPDHGETITPSPTGKE
jgi:excisionase family DNA binding protein